MKVAIMLQIQTILVPTDFSAGSDYALKVARSLAQDHGARLVLIAVPPPPPPMTDEYLPSTEYPGMIATTKRELEALGAKITDRPVVTHVIAGAPGPSIIEAAKEYQADLIVMGTHGRTGLARLLMGSVAEHVLRHAECPVLTIKPGTAQHWQQA